MPNNELDKGENGMGGLGGSPGNSAHNGRNVECVFSLYMDSFIGWFVYLETFNNIICINIK